MTVAARLAAVRSAVVAATPRGLLAAGRIYLLDQGRQFDQRSVGGGGWSPLDDETVRRKGNDRILVASGDMRASLNYGHPNNVCDVVPGPGGPALRVGTRDPKARFHQAGGPNLPRRPVVGPPTPEALRRMRDALVGEARRGVVQAMRR